jgi:hypothetical protein
MRLLKPKEDLILAARNAAYEAMKTDQRLSWNSSPVMDSLISMVSIGIEIGLREVLNNIYTDDDFEKDLTIKE